MTTAGRSSGNTYSRSNRPSCSRRVVGILTLKGVSF
jgi:hypothetical protein